MKAPIFTSKHRTQHTLDYKMAPKERDDITVDGDIKASSSKDNNSLVPDAGKVHLGK